jgi:hypothetical protein
VRGAVMVLLIGGAMWGATPKIVFTKSFPGSTPPFQSVSVDQNGSLEYMESASDDQPVTALMSHSEAMPLFEQARKLDYFRFPLDSGLKVANTGKKTFRYIDADGKSTETSFNYSNNEIARQLLDRFEQIAASERAYQDLDRAVHFDKLGVNEALAQIESLWLQKQLAAPQQFIPLLDRIIGHESFMHLVRERSAKLKEAFKGPAPVANAGTK